MHQQTSQALDNITAPPVASKPDLDRPSLLIMDVDSTLIDEEVIDLLGMAAGVGERITTITDHAMCGELDFAGSLKARVKLLRGLPVSAFDKVYAEVHFTRGAIDLINELHRHGWKVGVVSGGFHDIVDRLARQAHIDHWLANRLGTAHGVLTGEVIGQIVTKETKLHALRQWSADDGIDPDQIVAVGDGANDIPMIRAARLGIAFCAKPAVRREADRAITQRDLMEVVRILNE